MTVRVKLALVYGLLIVLTGAALMAVSYQLVAHKVPQGVAASASAKDVVLRANKLNKEAGISESDRRTLEAMLAQPPAQALNFLRKGTAPGQPYQLSQSTRTALTASLPATVRSDALHQLLVQSSIALGGLVALSLLLGWFVAGRILRPLRRITATAATLSASSLDQRIALGGARDELSQLADTFDAMLDRLAGAFEGQRRFVANASHELRTPLTIMATELDVTLRQPDATADDLRRMGHVVRGAVDRSDRLITSLLALAQVSGGLEVSAPTDLAVIVQESLQARAAELAAAGVRSSTELHPSLVVGDLGLLDRLVDNLVENAIVHNLRGGWVEVRTWQDAEAARLEISSSGALVPTAELPRLFTPFQRLDGRTGAGRRMGLGLSIVRAVATAHGGSAVAEPVIGGGLRVLVSLPIAEDPEPA